MEYQDDEDERDLEMDQMIAQKHRIEQLEKQLANYMYKCMHVSKLHVQARV
jgi:hypothetical protein